MNLFNSNYGGSYPNPSTNFGQLNTPILQPQIPMQTNPADMIWVQGEEAAKAYPLSRNSSVTLFDSEGDYFYIKSTDISGMPLKLRKFSYEEILEDSSQEVSSIAQNDVDFNMFATKRDLKEAMDLLSEEILKVSNRNSQNSKPKSNNKRSNQRRVIENE